MPPKGINSSINVWIRELENKQHREAVKYIEENVDLIDTDLQKFMDDCPSSCRLEVYKMLLKAGIDMKDYNDSLKRRDSYIHDANHQFKQYYTFEYIKGPNEYIGKLITWKTDWTSDCIVLDTIPAVEEN